MKVRRILPVILAGTLLITTVNYPQAVYAEDILGDENSGAYTVELSNEVLPGEKITEPAGIPDISGTLTNEDILIKEEEPAANGILTDENSLNNPEEIMPEVSEEIILNVNGDTSAVPEQEEVSAENSTEISGYVETSEAVPEEMNVKEFPPEGTGEEAPVRAITLSPSQKTIRADGGEFELKVSTYPAVKTGAGIECRPLDDNVTVSEYEDDIFLINSHIEELPKGKKSVKSRVEVRATDGYGAKAYCDITMVKGIDVIEISAPKDQHLLAVGKKLKLNAAVEPKDAYTGEIIWTSSDESVLKVDNKGNVTAVGTGLAEITATDNVSLNEDYYEIETYVPLSGIEVSPKTLTVESGKDVSYDLNCISIPRNATVNVDEIIFSVSDKDSNYIELEDYGYGYAYVMAKELPEGMKKATATVTVTAKDISGTVKKASCKVTVQRGDVKISSIKMSSSQLSLGEGSEQGLLATVEPNGASNTNLEWECDNPDIVGFVGEPTWQTVKLKALKPGKAKITAKSTDGSNKKAVCTVTVGNPVKSVKIKKKYDSLAVGKSLTLSAQATAAGGSKPANQRIIYRSSHPEVATVDSKGKVTAIAEGDVTIYAFSPEDSSCMDSCPLKVYVPVSRFAVEKSSITVNDGTKSSILIKSIEPANATVRTVEWTSSNENIVELGEKLYSDGKEIGISFDALKVGTAKVTGTITDIDQKTKKVTVTIKVVKGMEEKDVLILIKNPPQGVEVEKNESKHVAVYTDEKKTFKLTPVLTPKAANNKVSFRSSDTEVARVDKSGKVTTKDEGEATITMTTDDGGYKAYCYVYVGELD